MHFTYHPPVLAAAALAAVVLASCRDATEPEAPNSIEPPVFSLSIGDAIQITTDPGHSRYPAISGDRIVWHDSRTGLTNIFMYDLTTGEETQITSAGGAVPDISGDRIVYHAQRVPLDQNVYLFDFATGTETQITTDPKWQGHPKISGSRIVWSDWRKGNLDIFMYDLETGVETQITTDPATQVSPQISGDLIVWEDTRTGDRDIFMHDLTTGEETRITYDPLFQRFPMISGDRIVWGDIRFGGGEYQIFMYDVTAGTERQITASPARPGYKSISGNFIVWSDWRNPGGDIFMFDLESNQEVQVTSDPGQVAENDVFGDRIVWAENLSGNWDIFMVELSTAVVPAIEAIADQVDQFVSDGLIDTNTGIQHSLVELLEQAAAAFDRGNAAAAASILSRGFINLVTAQAGKKISTEAAQILIELAQEVVDDMSE